MNKGLVGFIIIISTLLVCRYVDISCAVSRESASILMYSIFWLPGILILYFLSRYKSQSKISKIIAKITYLAGLFWVLNIAFTFSSCGNIDHSDDIKSMAVPMQKELKLFYQQNKRFPDIQERNEMLEKIGCRVNEDVCNMKNKKIVIHSSVARYDYMISFYMNNTYCTSWLKEDGHITELWCQNKPCIDLGQ